MVLGATALIILGVIGTVHDSSLAQLSVPLHQQGFLGVVRFVMPVFPLALGIRMFTDEFRHGTIVPTLLASPDRRRVLTAKVAVMVGAAVVFVVVSVAVAIGLGAALVSAKGIEITVATGPLLAEIGRILVVTMLWAAMGVGVGLVVKHQVAAAVGALIWLLAGENIVGAVFSGIARYLPAHASYGVFGGQTGVLAPAAAGIVLAAWTAVALGAGAVVMQRRDIA
jgi:ABC-type transport system involved in multi-copper enzyme maturation permease subunit